MNKKVWAMTAIAIASLVVAGAGIAEGTTGAPTLLGRHNCSGSVNDRQCSGDAKSTSLDWNLDYGKVPGGSGFAVQGDPGVVGVTNPSYAFDPGLIAAVEGYGSDAGGFFYGVDQGVVSSGDDGIEAHGSQNGVQAFGPVGVDARGDSVGVSASGPTALEAEGQVTFSTAGLIRIPAGKASGSVQLDFDVWPDTKVLATLQTQGGTLKRVSRDVDDDSFTVWLTAPATQQVVVAYFVIS